MGVVAPWRVAPGSAGAQRLLPAGRAANPQGGVSPFSTPAPRRILKKISKKKATGAAKKAAAAAKARE